MDVRVAATHRARLLGLAGLKDLPAGAALLLVHTRCVHTLGMRSCIDLIWLDARGHPVRTDRAVPPCRLRRCRRARAVVELATDQGR